MQHLRVFMYSIIFQIFLYLVCLESVRVDLTWKRYNLTHEHLTAKKINTGFHHFFVKKYKNNNFQLLYQVSKKMIK